jgi:hypothetical protein
MPGNFYRNRFVLLAKWCESLGTADGKFAAIILMDIWHDLLGSEFENVDDDSDPREVSECTA